MMLQSRDKEGVVHRWAEKPYAQYFICEQQLSSTGTLYCQEFIHLEHEHETSDPVSCLMCLSQETS